MFILERVNCHRIIYVRKLLVRKVSRFTQESAYPVGLHLPKTRNQPWVKQRWYPRSCDQGHPQLVILLPKMGSKLGETQLYYLGSNF